MIANRRTGLMKIMAAETSTNKNVSYIRSNLPLRSILYRLGNTVTQAAYASDIGQHI